MFVERLTDEQIFDFIRQNLTADGSYSIEDNCTIIILPTEKEDNKMVNITAKFNPDYSMSLDIHDFDIYVWKDPYLIFDIDSDNQTLLAHYIKYLYQIFGEEYKVLYKANVDAIARKVRKPNDVEDAFLYFTPMNFFD